MDSNILSLRNHHKLKLYQNLADLVPDFKFRHKSTITSVHPPSVMTLIANTEDAI